ncbi:MAG: hypothetical protein ACKPKO_61330, partial [Candidatus Fonsibacter sp.]
VQSTHESVMGRTARTSGSSSSSSDTMMQRLMGYIHNTLHLRMIGWVGDSRKHMFPHFFADADFAGDVDTQRANSGYYSVT